MAPLNCLLVVEVVGCGVASKGPRALTPVLNPNPDLACLLLRTRVFARDTVIMGLEKIRAIKLQEMDKAATLLQATWRMSMQRKVFWKCLRGEGSAGNVFRV